MTRFSDDLPTTLGARAFVFIVDAICYAFLLFIAAILLVYIGDRYDEKEARRKAEERGAAQVETESHTVGPVVKTRRTNGTR
jgi:hypothetical protein